MTTVDNNLLPTPHGDFGVWAEKLVAWAASVKAGVDGVSAAASSANTAAATAQSAAATAQSAASSAATAASSASTAASTANGTASSAQTAANAAGVLAAALRSITDATFQTNLAAFVVANAPAGGGGTATQQEYPLFFPGALTASATVPLADGKGILIGRGPTTLSLLRAAPVGYTTTDNVVLQVRRGGLVQGTITIPSGTASGTFTSVALTTSSTATTITAPSLLDTYLMSGTVPSGGGVSLYFGTDSALLPGATPVAPAPTANAGTTQSVAAGVTVTLNGTGSSDPLGAALTYAWTQTSGGAVTLSSTTAASPTFTAPSSASASTLVFSLTVSNGSSSSSPASVTINVAATVAASNPSTIFGASLKAWFVADDIAGTSGTQVASWTDRVAAIGAAQATSSARPTLQTAQLNGHSAVRFTGSSSQSLGFSATGMLATANAMVYVVAKTAAGGGNRLLCMVPFTGGDDYDGPAAWDLTYNSGAPAAEGGNSAAGYTVSQAAGVPSNAFHSIVGTRTATAIRVYVDNVGATATSQTYSALNVGDFYIGKQKDFGQYFTGDIAEIGIVTGTVTGTQLNSLATYLNTTYGI